jgi:hypothetical protein
VSTIEAALTAIDEEIIYHSRLAKIFGDDEDLIGAGVSYEQRAELWRWIRDRVEVLQLQALHDYLEQPDVLMSIPQPHRLKISELLHGEGGK